MFHVKHRGFSRYRAGYVDILLLSDCPYSGNLGWTVSIYLYVGSALRLPGAFHSGVHILHSLCAL